LDKVKQSHTRFYTVLLSLEYNLPLKFALPHNTSEHLISDVVKACHLHASARKVTWLMCIVFPSGEFGVVYKAHLQWHLDAATEVVAVKILKGIPLGHHFH